MEKPAPSKNPLKVSNENLLIGFISFVLVFGIAFYAGAQYQKKHAINSLNTVTTQPFMTNGLNGGGMMGLRQFGRGRGINLGTVSSVSTSSITVQSRRTGSNVTYAITGSTIVTNNGQPAKASDIKNGDTVAVITSNTNLSQAASIIINPGYGGGPQTQSTTN